MKTFKYETHLHTIEGSACATSKATDYIEIYRNFGYAGIFVTNHFFGGNTCVPQGLPWKERVELYCSGYELALEACKKYSDFKVFFGFEQTFDGDDYLVYGLDKKWLLENPDVENMTHRQLYFCVKNAGGLMIQAHPFRLRPYIQAIHLHPRDVDGVEVYNGGNLAEENALALMYAKSYDFPMTGGSDIHNIDFVANSPDKVYGVEFNSPIEDVFDFARRIKAKDFGLVRN